MRVLRHEIQITDRQVIALPAGGKLISTAASRTSPASVIDVWSIDYETGPPQDVDVYIFGTGNPIVEKSQREAVERGAFLGTVVTGTLVWHVWAGPRDVIVQTSQNHGGEL